MIKWSITGLWSAMVVVAAALACTGFATDLGSETISRSAAFRSESAEIRDGLGELQTLDLSVIRENLLSLLLRHVDNNSGAITLQPLGSRGNIVHPWFAYSAARGLLEAGTRYRAVVERWLGWLCAHSNSAAPEDLYGTNSISLDQMRAGWIRGLPAVTRSERLEAWRGTFFKFRANEDGSYSKIYLAPTNQGRTGDRDSNADRAQTATDNWSASMIITMNAYLKDSKDSKIWDRCESVVGDAANHIVGLMDGFQDRGLTHASPDVKTQYTTDNMYSFAGLESYSEIMSRIGDRPRAQQFASYASAIKRGIFERLKSDDGDHFLAYFHQSSFDWRNFYGDGVANIQGATMDDAQLREAGAAQWSRFVSNNGSWANFMTGKLAGRGQRSSIMYVNRDQIGKWSMVAFAAVRSDDPTTALTFVYNMAARYHSFDGTSDMKGLDVNELGWLLRAVLALQGSVVIDDPGARVLAGNAERVSLPQRASAITEEADGGSLARPRLGRGYLAGAPGSQIAIPLSGVPAGSYHAQMLYFDDNNQSKKVRVTMSCSETSENRAPEVIVDQSSKLSTTSLPLGPCIVRAGKAGQIIITSDDGKGFSFDGLVLVRN